MKYIKMIVLVTCMISVLLYSKEINKFIDSSSLKIFPPDPVIIVPDYGTYVIYGGGHYDTISLGTGSHLYIQPNGYSDVYVKNINTPILPVAKFDEYSINISVMVDQSMIQTMTLNISETAILHGVEMSDIKLLLYDQYDYPTEVSINYSKISNYSYEFELGSAGISIINGNTFTINNTTIDNFSTGIQVSSVYKNSKSYVRITNNTISFDPDVASKTAKKVGIIAENSFIEIEDNLIINSDTAIEISSSEGRVADNTIRMESLAASKYKSLGKIAINVIQESNTIIDDNNIWITDTNSAIISAINVENSSAEIYYNKINFEDAYPAIRNGLEFNNVLDVTYAYNNTIFNATYGINNIPGTGSIDFINNIIWNEGSYSAGVGDPTNINFYNNCIKDLSGITGSDNISVDPLFYDPSTNDLALSGYSQCINAGKIIDGFHIADTNYFGSAPDIGAYEYYEESSLNSPSNISISSSDDTYTIGWDAVAGASYYKIFSSSDPYSGFSLLGTTSNTSFSTTLRPDKKFFYVVASSDPVK